jgi:hypothetical protein
MTAMLQRHKIPTIFNIYMLDVICCALGCVVLLWQVAHREAEQQTADAKESHAEAEKQSDAAVRARVEFEKAQQELLSASNDVTQLQAELAAWKAKHQGLTQALAATEKDRAQVRADAGKINVELLAKIAGADKKAKELATALVLSEESARRLALDSKDAQTKLKLADLQRTSLLLERDSLKVEKDALNRKIVALQAEAEQRFAGIPLTGESVVFLIDISGSMVRKDEKTEDPEKWPFLCDTLMQLMKSIPTMQRFQVILFSDKTRYLFGERDSWLKYEGPATAQLTRDALFKVKVEGGTNMEEGFDEAFRYRKLKLDTIYLFSDGLPNIGSGVPASIRNPTEEQRNQFMGKFVRDKLKTDWNRPEKGLNDVRINAVGFFFESPDVGAFLWAMAREHRGAFVGVR